MPTEKNKKLCKMRRNKCGYMKKINENIVANGNILRLIRPLLTNKTIFENTEICSIKMK